MVYATAFAKSPWVLAHFWLMAGAFVLGWIASDLRWLWLGVVLICCLWPFTIGYLNPNYIGVSVVLALAAAVVYGFYWYIPIGLLGVLALGSRGALLGTGVLGFAWLVRKAPFLACAVLIVALSLIYILSADRMNAIADRLGVWQDTINHITFLGSGLGSFSDAYAVFPVRTNMVGILAPGAYNDYLQLVFELGIGVLPLWALIAISLDSDRSALIPITFLALGLTYFPLFIPILGQLFALALGHCAARRKQWHAGV